MNPKAKEQITSKYHILILEEQQEQRGGGEEYDDTESPLLTKYDEFAAKVVAAENKKGSEQKLKRLTN
jgi:hypothetical protein